MATQKFLEDNADATKGVDVNMDAITTGNFRVISWRDRDITPMSVDEIGIRAENIDTTTPPGNPVDHVFDGEIQELVTYRRNGSKNLRILPGAQTFIDGSADKTLTSDGDSITLLRDGSDIYVISENAISDSVKTLSGAGAPGNGTTTAYYAGQQYFDTTNNIMYRVVSPSTNPFVGAAGSTFSSMLISPKKEAIQLTAPMIAAKEVTSSHAPDASSVQVTWSAGGSAADGFGVNVTGSDISWNGEAWDGVLQVGDVLLLSYNA